MKKNLLLVVALFIGVTAYAGNVLSVINANDSGDGSLRQLIADATSGDEIVIPVSVSEIVLSSDIQIVNKSLTLKGNGCLIRVSEPAVSTYRIFTLENEQEGNKITVVLDGFQLKGGDISSLTDDLYMTQSGACVLVKPNIIATIKNTDFLSGKAAYAGGVRVRSNDADAKNIIFSELTLQNCIFSNLSSTGNGGAAYCDVNSAITIDRCTFEANSTSKDGGALVVNKSDKAKITNSYFVGNKAASTRGGAIFTTGATGTPIGLIVENSTFSNNEARRGGAFGTSSVGTTSFTNCTFFKNNALGSGEDGVGGALYSVGGKCEVIVLYCTIVNNIAENKAAGIYANQTSPAIFTVVNSIVTHNRVGSNKDNMIVNQSNLNGTNNIVEGAVGVGTSSKAKNNLLATIEYSMQSLFDPDAPELVDNGGYTITVKLKNDGIAVGKATLNYGNQIMPVTDQRGKQRTTLPSVGAYEPGIISGIGETTAAAQYEFGIYPNPITNGFANVINAGNTLTVQVYNMEGQLLHQLPIVHGTINLSGFPKGMYLIRAEDLKMVKVVVR